MDCRFEGIEKSEEITVVRLWVRLLLGGRARTACVDVEFPTGDRRAPAFHLDDDIVELIHREDPDAVSALYLQIAAAYRKMAGVGYPPGERLE